MTAAYGRTEFWAKNTLVVSMFFGLLGTLVQRPDLLEPPDIHTPPDYDVGIDVLPPVYFQGLVAWSLSTYLNLSTRPTLFLRTLFLSTCIATSLTNAAWGYTDENVAYALATWVAIVFAYTTLFVVFHRTLSEFRLVDWVCVVISLFTIAADTLRLGYPTLFAVFISFLSALSVFVSGQVRHDSKQSARQRGPQYASTHSTTKVHYSTNARLDK